MLNKNVCYSGGSKGSDELFGKMAESCGHYAIHWSFQMHKSMGTKENTRILPAFKLAIANDHLNIANKYLKRKFPSKSEYVNNLLRRNYYQILYSERIYAVCEFDNNMAPLGGTAWAIIMGINIGIDEIYVYETTRNSWITFKRKHFNDINRYAEEWEHIDYDVIPKPHGHYAGIGKSELSGDGKQAIISLYEKE